MYEIQLPVFQGPLELLLHLIERRQLDITTLSLIEVTEQYMEHVRSAEQIDMASLADFLVIAAKLLYIKSVSLLPKSPSQDSVEEEDPGAELTRLLEEYKKFRAVAMDLREKEESGLRSYPRMVPAPRPAVRPGPLELTLDELLKAIEKILSKETREQISVVERRTITISERTGILKARLAAGKMFTFRSFISDCASREAIVVSLLATLELVKARELEVRQEALFGDIYIYPLKGEPHAQAV